MKLKYTILLLLLPFILFGQKTKKIKNKETKEVYHVLESNNDIREGRYQKFSYKESLLVNGFYKNGLKDSIWEYYNIDNKIVHKYSYAQNKLIYFEPYNKITSKYTFIALDNPQDSIFNIPPIYLGGNDKFMNDQAYNITYPSEALKHDITGKVYVSFTLDKSGKTSNYHVKKPLGYGLDEESIRFLKSVSENWIPAIQNNKAVTTEITCLIKYNLQ